MKTTLPILLLYLLSSSLYGQWASNTDVNTNVAASVTGDIQSVGTNDGKTYVAFWHEVPAPQNYEMRVQLLDQAGNRLFGDEGMVVNNTVPMSTFTTLWSVAVDRENNVYIGFNGTDGGNPVYFHKISESGTQLWGDSGINPGSGFDPKMLPLSNGDVMLCWLPGNKGVMQKFSAAGTAVWANPVTIEPTVANHRTSAGELAELSNGDVVVLLHDRGGFSPSSLPYAQRYAGDGATVWASPVALSTTYFTVFNRRYNLLQDVDTLYFGYAGAQGIQPHGFVQRIDPDGTLPWGTNGSDFSTQTALFEQEVKIAFMPGSDVVWAVAQYSNTSQSQLGTYVQKFDKTTGARLLSDEAKEIFPISDAYIALQGNIQVVNDQPVFLVADGNSNGVFPIDLLAVYLNPDGGFAWPEETRPVATSPDGVKSRVQLNAPYNGKVVAAWAEDRPETGDSRPYAQQVEVVVSCVPPVAGFTFTASGLGVEFTSTATNATNAFWTFGDGTTFVGADTTHVYQTEGTYTVCQYVINDCEMDTLCQEVLVETSGVSQLENLYRLKLSPNPGSGPFVLTLQMPEAGELSYQLLTASGQSLFTRKAKLTSGQQVVPVVTEALPGGNYFLNVRINGKETVLRLIVR